MRKACVLIDETSLMDDGVNCDVEPPRHGCGLSAIIEGAPQRPFCGHMYIFFLTVLGRGLTPILTLASTLIFGYPPNGDEASRKVSDHVSGKRS